jgi:hypothetical protein
VHAASDIGIEGDVLYGPRQVQALVAVATASLHFTNGTTSTLTVAVRYPDQGNEFVLQSKIEPGMTSVTRSDVFPGNTCSDRGVLIARDSSGAEVARRAGRVCKGDAWVITTGGFATPSD